MPSDFCCDANVPAPFSYLRAGMVDRTQDTRVVVLGSSNANGAYTTEPDKAMFQRLSRRSGGSGLKKLDTVTTNQPPQGMTWWTGAQGDTTSANYYPSARRAAMARVNPHYVIHVIGENDLYYGTSRADYKANMIDACEHIESLNPQAINILVHSHGRNDVHSPVTPWLEYRDALREVADLLPTRRRFLDTTPFYDVLGVMDDNRSSLLVDTVHLGDTGHLRQANIIGRFMGIPSETDYIGAPAVYDFPLPSNTTTFGNGSLLAEIWWESAAYPREFLVTGSIWAGFTNANGYMTLASVLVNGTTLHAISTKPSTTVATGLPINAAFYLPPGTGGSVKIVLWPGPGVVQVQGRSTKLSHVKGMFIAV